MILSQAFDNKCDIGRSCVRNPISATLRPRNFDAEYRLTFSCLPSQKSLDHVQVTTGANLWPFFGGKKKCVSTVAVRSHVRPFVFDSGQAKRERFSWS